MTGVMRNFSLPLVFILTLLYGCAHSGKSDAVQEPELSEEELDLSAFGPSVNHSADELGAESATVVGSDAVIGDEVAAGDHNAKVSPVATLAAAGEASSHVIKPGSTAGVGKAAGAERDPAGKPSRMLGSGGTNPKNRKCVLQPVPAYGATDTYSRYPFKAGEVAKYNLDYGAIHVGYGYMRVGKPVEYPIIVGFAGNKPIKKSGWHMVFSGHAYTGSWYKGIYEGNNKVFAYSRPWDFAISKFYLEEKASTLFSSVHKKKNLYFHQGKCRVYTHEKDLEEDQEKKGSFELLNGAVDALGGFYKLRTYDYSKGSVRFMAYSSEKNWALEAIPKGVEVVKVPAGTFKADRLIMKTFLGDKLEQRGDLTVWVAKTHPSRPLVKISGVFKFGDITLELTKFKPGS